MPKHVAIVMDGNSRWAAARGLSRTDGHAAGLRAARETIGAALVAGIPNLTLYAFSATNWAWPRDELRAVLQLLSDFSAAERESFRQLGIRVNVLGSLDDFPNQARHALEQLVQGTAAGARMTVSLALSYGGRRDIVDAARWLATRARAGLTLPEEIDEAFFCEHLASRDLPVVDVLIRTGGQARLGDSLLFQAANAELVFLPMMWPEFGAEALRSALERCLPATEDRLSNATRAESILSARG